MQRIFILALIASLAATPALGAGSGTIAHEHGQDIRLYNQGVELRLKKDFTAAERKFRAALAERDRFAEAHNNTEENSCLKNRKRMSG